MTITTINDIESKENQNPQSMFRMKPKSRNATQLYSSALSASLLYHRHVKKHGDFPQNDVLATQ